MQRDIIELRPNLAAIPRGTAVQVKLDAIDPVLPLAKEVR